MYKIIDFIYKKIKTTPKFGIYGYIIELFYTFPVNISWFNIPSIILNPWISILLSNART